MDTVRSYLAVLLVVLVRFGDEYRHYQEEVPRLAPRLSSNLTAASRVRGFEHEGCFFKSLLKEM